MIDVEDMLERFLSYASVDTHSDIHSTTTPSTPGQWKLIHLLENELEQLGVPGVRVSPHGFVVASLPATSTKTRVPRLALIAHVDTAYNLPGRARPLVHRKYNGRPIALPDDPALILNPQTAPQLASKIGEDIVTASGNSVLGAGGKAGIAVIMAVLKYFLAHPEIPRGRITLCFNSDEEIGRGTDKIRIEELDADVAYTLDSENPGQVDFETFSAERATINIVGVPSHPGWAAGVMVNALHIAQDILNAIPRELCPENSRGREGYIHPCDISGTAERIRLEIILRDFEMDGLLLKHRLINDTVAKLTAKYPRAKIEVQFDTQYRNMRYWLEKDMRPVEMAREAILRAGLKPTSESIRGGTDGARLTERGLPTPNLFVGYHNTQSLLEWISVQDMAKSAETLLHLIQIWEEKS